MAWPGLAWPGRTVVTHAVVTHAVVTHAVVTHAVVTHAVVTHAERFGTVLGLTDESFTSEGDVWSYGVRAAAPWQC